MKLGRDGRRCVLASGNAAKLRELEAMLAPLRWQLVAQGALGIESVDETGAGFIDNALLKARHASAHSGLPAIADDSGLVVDALDGAPGIRSARYAGEPSDDAANNAALLAALDGVADAGRGARFHCALVMVRRADDPAPLVCEGRWHGRILRAPEGDNGFGYDPLFFVAPHGRSAAALDAETKNRISHRGRAMRRLRRALGAA